MKYDKHNNVQDQHASSQHVVKIPEQEFDENAL
jgi:hypothetical protein